MTSSFRNEGEMRSARYKPLIDTRNISNYHKTGHGWVTRILLVFTILLWLLLALVENGHV